MLALVEDFRPHVLHGHWLQMAPLVGRLSLRSHADLRQWSEGYFRGRREDD